MPKTKINVRIVELFWARDLDDARHAAIRAEHIVGLEKGHPTDLWTALFYEHPSNGWQVTELTIEKFSAPNARGDSGRVYLDSLTDPDAAKEFERIVGVLVTHAPLDGLADDLYELGRRGANRRWKHRYVTLVVDPAIPSGEVSDD